MIKVSGNEIIFTIESKDIIKCMIKNNKVRLAECIEKKYNYNIVRTALVNDSNDVKKKTNSLIKFLYFTILNSLLECSNKK